MKKIVISTFVILLILVIGLGWLLNVQYQSQIKTIQAQNEELSNQINSLQSEIDQFNLQSKERQDRLKDYTYQLALARPLKVKIVDFKWLGGFNPLGGLTITHPINVTVQNTEVVPIFGLGLSVRLQDRNLGTPIGEEMTTPYERINATSTMEISGAALTTLTINGAVNLENAVCIATIKVGSIVLDEWKFEL